MRTVHVLMSSYNGEKYIREQLDSLLAQKNVEVYVTIRDDGSKDQTRAIIEEYIRQYRNVSLWEASNIGAEKSFSELCSYVLQNGEVADYYAFCDQDDVWFDNKLDQAVKKLDLFDKKLPNLYFSNLKCVDEKLTPLGMFFNRGEVNISKEYSFLQSYCYGCTCVFNRKALEYYCLKKGDFLHDYWIEIVCMYLGNVVYDNESYILYRQHSNNLSGGKRNRLQIIKTRVNKLFNNRFRNDFQKMAIEMLSLFEHLLSKDDIEILTCFANYSHSFKAKAKLLLYKRYQAKDLLKNMSIKYRILINKW